MISPIKEINQQAQQIIEKFRERVNLQEAQTDIKKFRYYSKK
jgi:hypothetical protein